MTKGGEGPRAWTSARIIHPKPLRPPKRPFEGVEEREIEEGGYVIGITDASKSRTVLVDPIYPTVFVRRRDARLGDMDRNRGAATFIFTKKEEEDEREKKKKKDDR